ncbi:MAG: Rne/Rng family ribonuclease, partial [Pyrinomonadaceae bacterium]
MSRHDRTQRSAGSTSIDVKETAAPASLASTRGSTRTSSRTPSRAPSGGRSDRQHAARQSTDGKSTDLIEDKIKPPIKSPAARSPVSDTLARTIGLDAESPFVSRAADFQRIVDEENAAEEGEMLKDAMIQERIFDQIHAIEFDIEDPRPIEVGSLLSNNSVVDKTGFERVEDGFIAEPSEPSELSDEEDNRPAEITFTRVNTKIDEIESEVDSEPKVLFERVSDEDFYSKKAEAETLKKPGRPRRRGKEVSDEPIATPKRARGSGRSKNIVEPEDSSDVATEHASFSESTEATDESPETGEPYADMEASIDSHTSRAEFARRGGRRRRHGTGTAQVETDANTEAAEETASGGNAGGNAGGNGSGRDDLSEREISTSILPDEMAGQTEETEAPAIIKVKPARSSNATRSGRGNSPNGSRRDANERGSVTIADLLREGQEILVQIAKEPISSKGARITSHIALPGRHLVYMPTVEHVGVSRKIESDSERVRLRKLIQAIRAEEDVPSGGFIVRTAGIGISEKDLREDARYLVRTWLEIKRKAEKAKAPTLLHRDLDLVQRILRDHISDDFAAIRVDSEDEYLRIVEFINRVQPALIKRVKLYTRDIPVLETYGVQDEIDKAVKPRVWLNSGGYLVINQTEALVAVDVNTGKFVGRGGKRLEDTITRTNLEAVEEIARQIRLRDLGGIIVLDLIDMIERRNRQKVMQVLQDALQKDKSPTKVLAFNDFGLVIMTRKRVKQSLERTLCSPCPTCQGSGLVKSPQTVCYEILEEARHLAKGAANEGIKQTTLRVN